MKGNIKRVAVLVIIAAIAVFMVGMASAANNANVTGEYAFSGRVSYILTPSGFNPTTLIPSDPSSVTSNSINCQGIFTFKRDGTGTFDSTGVLLALPPQVSPPIPRANAFTWWFTFTYDVADDDTITIDAVKNSFHVTFDTGLGGGVVSFTADTYPLSGMVSVDHKTITLGSPTTFIQTLTFKPSGIVLQGIPNSSYVLTRLRQGEGGK